MSHTIMITTNDYESLEQVIEVLEEQELDIIISAEIDLSLVTLELVNTTVN